jgi:hypothetical protein
VTLTGTVAPAVAGLTGTWLTAAKAPLSVLNLWVC